VTGLPTIRAGKQIKIKAGKKTGRDISRDRTKENANYSVL